jgi:hypothetical protein
LADLNVIAYRRQGSAKDYSGASVVTSGASRYRRLKGRDRKLDRIDDVRAKVDYSMEPSQFMQKLQQTQVLATKEYTKWDWDLIEETLEGPLRNPVHFTTATQRTTFIKRILSFLKPKDKSIMKESHTVVRSSSPTSLPDNYCANNAWGHADVMQVRAHCVPVRGTAPAERGWRGVPQAARTGAQGGRTLQRRARRGTATSLIVLYASSTQRALTSPCRNRRLASSQKTEWSS